MIGFTILSGLRVYEIRSREINYLGDSCWLNNKSHNGPIQYVFKLKTHQLKVSTSMIKTNYLSWCAIVFADETPNFITDYELYFEFTRNLWFISSVIKSHKSHTMHLKDYDNVPLEVVRLIIQVIVVDWIINLTTV